MGDVGNPGDIVSNATYGPSNELLSMSGESRTYNSMLQLTQLTESVGGTQKVNITYSYSATQNNGKITSQTDNLSGEQVVYTYDALNRLASAQAADNSWGQSYSYDEFGNLTDQNVIAGSAPTYHTVYDPSNHRGCEDANGNTGGSAVSPCSSAITYDVENRMLYWGLAGQFRYSYAPGNKRIWRGTWTYPWECGPDGFCQQVATVATDEVTFWSVNGQKLATYQLTDNTTTQQVTAAQTGTWYYFGGKMIKNASGYVGTDRLGSIGHFYPYGQEKPSATQNGTEKFAGYLRDSETGMDYAINRYHVPGTGRFLTPDPYQNSAGPTDPGSWNRYAYTRGDPINRKDRKGQDDCGDDFMIGADLTCWGDPNDIGDEGTIGDESTWGFCNVDGLLETSPSCPDSSTANDDQQQQPPPPCHDWSCMPAAFSTAIAALTLNQDCWNLFGNANSREKGWDPTDVLTDIVWGDHTHGSVGFANMGPGNSAATTPSGHGIGLLTGKATITINEYTDPSGQYAYWNAGYTGVNAELLLHELAHAYTLLRGSGGFDGTRFISDAKLDSLIQTDCFPGGVN